MPAKVGETLGKNVKALRVARGLSQAQMAKIADIPRATWANLESGEANPTLHVLDRVAFALQVSLEELISTQRADAKHHPRGTLPVRQRGNVTIEKFLPDALPGMDIDRMTFPAGGRMVGIPHTPGTREYLICETGRLRLTASGESFDLAPHDVEAFRGDQKHGYENLAGKVSVAYSIVVLARAPSD